MVVPAFPLYSPTETMCVLPFILGARLPVHYTLAYQPGSHRTKVTLGILFSSTSLLRYLSWFFRDKDSTIPFPRRHVSNLCTPELIDAPPLGRSLAGVAKQYLVGHTGLHVRGSAVGWVGGGDL